MHDLRNPQGGNGERGGETGGGNYLTAANYNSLQKTQIQHDGSNTARGNIPE